MSTRHPAAHRRSSIVDSPAFASALAWVHTHRGLTVAELGDHYALPTTTVTALLERGEARAHSGDIPITRIEDLPEHRRPPTRYGLGRHPELLEQGQTLDQQYARLSLLPCGVERHAAPPSRAHEHAKEGEDGLYHLRRDGRSRACTRGGTHQAPVRLLRERLSVTPAVVPENLRCEPKDPRWGTGPAPHSHRASAMVRLVDELRATQGLSCGACHKRLSDVVDHDHTTGMVRGLLCTPCNVAVDSCPHLGGCPFAEYLNAPPAPAGIRYPRNRARTPSITPQSPCRR